MPRKREKQDLSLELPDAAWQRKHCRGPSTSPLLPAVAPAALRMTDLKVMVEHEHCRYFMSVRYFISMQLFSDHDGTRPPA